MRRALFALATIFAIACPSFAQTDSPLELVRALRASGLVDLAVMKLEELRADPSKLKPAEAQILPLELARIRLEEASRETDDGRRATLIGQARGAFEEFLKNNPTHPMAAQANVEIARLLALQAKARLSRGNRLEGSAKALEYSRARPNFTEAINRYQGAIVNLENRIKGLDEKDPLAIELNRSKAQAELDAVVLQYELALSFAADDETRQRAEQLDKAQKAFEKLISKYSEKRVGYLATVWSLQTANMLGDAKALPNLDRFVNAQRNNREAADAIRLASFFGIEHTYAADTPKENPAQKFQRTERAAEQWLRTYPDARNTPEGLGARYRLALMKEQQALISGNVRYEEPPKSKGKESQDGPRRIVGITGGAKAMLEAANKIYKELSETDNEYSERAQRHRLTNQLIILEGEGKGGDPPLKSINTLEQGFLAAQVQLARILEEKQTEDKRQADEKKRIQNATDYLERGLRLVHPKDNPRDVFDAQMLLVRFLTQNERAMEAAVLGEALARNNPKVPKAALAAQLAVYAYNTAFAKLKAAGGSDEDEEADLARIRALAQFAEATWPNDGPTDGIRHVMAYYQANREPKDLETAWATYSRIGSGYPDLYQARRELAGVMFYLVRPEEKDPRKYREGLMENIGKRAAQWRATLGSLESLTEPPPGCTAHEAESWAGAKTMQAQLYYLAGDHANVEKSIKLVTDGVKKFTNLEDKKRDDLASTARVLKYNSLQSRAADFIRAKEFAKIGEVLGPEIDALKAEVKLAPPAEPPPGYERMRKAQRDFLIAAMSGYVQDQKVDKASELLDSLQSSGGSLESNIGVMQLLVTAIRGQIDTLTRDGKKGEADDLARGFAEFLDKIRGEDVSKLSSGVVIFLGQGYGAVNQHARAAELFEQLIAKPFENPGKTDDEKKQHEADHQAAVRQMRFLQARALRQAGGKANFDKATAIMQEIVGDPLKKGGALGWGYKNLAIRKEYIALLEDQKLFRPALDNWSLLAAEFGGAQRGAPPAPVKILVHRVAFVTIGQAIDEFNLAGFGLASPFAPALDVWFKSVLPTIAQKRNVQRQTYFDIFVEIQRCSARAYSTIEPAKIKGGQEKINQSLTDIGQRLFDMTTKNDDVPPEVKEKVHEVLELYPAAKKKFVELAAATPKA